MSYLEAKEKYAAFGVDTDAAIETLKSVPLALHCWQGDDVRGFDTDPSKPRTQSPTRHPVPQITPTKAVWATTVIRKTLWGCGW